MDLKTIEKVVGRIQRSLFRNANFYSIGMLKSHFRGFGLQFKDHQIYSHGDDVRFIDWKVLARTNTPYIKTFDEERNVEIIVVLDLSPSMLMGYENTSKLQAAVEIISLLYILAHKTKDRVTCILVAEEIKVLPNKSGKEGIALLVSLLEKMNAMLPNGDYNPHYRISESIPIIERLALIKKYLARNKEVVVLSDFVSFLDSEQLKNIIYNRNLHCFQITAPLDEASGMPFMLFGQNLMDGRKQVVKQKTLVEQERLRHSLGGKFKRLSVKERYLEDFVKEML